MNIKQVTSPMPNLQGAYPINNLTANAVNFLMQLGSLCYHAQRSFLGYSHFMQDGSVTIFPSSTPLVGSWVDSETSISTTPADDPYRPPGKKIIWGDVLKGIEEVSHNITAALLTLQLGTMNSTCFFDQLVEVYQYNSFALWVPYGVSAFSLLPFYNLTFSPLCFIAVLGCCSNFAHVFCNDNGEKQHWTYHNIILGYSYFSEERG